MNFSDIAISFIPNNDENLNLIEDWTSLLDEN